MIDLDYDDDAEKNAKVRKEEENRPLSNSHYRNAELAMLCTKSVNTDIFSVVYYKAHLQTVSARNVHICIIGCSLRTKK